MLSSVLPLSYLFYSLVCSWSCRRSIVAQLPPLLPDSKLASCCILSPSPVEPRTLPFSHLFDSTVAGSHSSPQPFRPQSVSFNMSAKRFSKEGFQPLPEGATSTMANPHDATIDIPLTPVNSQGQTGARKATSNRPPSTYRAPPPFPTDEKQSHFRQGPGGRRHKMEERGRGNVDDEDGTLTVMGKLYSAIYNFSVVTRYFLYVLPLALVIAAPIVVGATVDKPAEIGGVSLVRFFIWVEVVWLSLWVSKLVAQFLPYAFQFLCGIVSSGTRKYSLVLTALEIPLSLVGWSVSSLATFRPVMDVDRSWKSVVNSILFAIFFSTLVLLAEKFLIQLISISYHRKQFDEKIKNSKRNIYLLSLLYDASRQLFPAYCREFAADDYLINDSLNIGGSKSGSRHGRSGSATPMRLIQNVERIGDRVTAAVGNVAHEITGKQVFNPTSAHSIVVEALEKTASSEALARRLWMSFVVEGKDALYPEDIDEVLGSERAEEAAECFRVLDRDGNGDISLDEMILTVCEFGKERYSIANSMHDVDQAISVLDSLLMTVAFIIVVFIFLAFLNKSFVTTLATAGTALISLSFVFAASCQEVLGSCIFLFVKHPFDVGDRVDIGESQLVVERISLLFTIFRKINDHKCTQVPNIVLNTNWIDNITRSRAMREQISINVSADTSLGDIQLLKKQLIAFVVDKENSRDFHPDVEVEVIDIPDLSKLEVKVEVRHKSNWANEALRASRRSKFMCALVLAVRQIPIYGPEGGCAPAGDPANPTYSVAISHELAEVNKKDFADNKDRKRLVPAGTSPSSFVLNASSQIPMSPVPQSPLSTVAQDNAAVKSMDTQAAALNAVRDEAKKDSNNVASQRSNDIEEMRNILHQGSAIGRRRATSTASTAQSVPPAASVSVSPPPVQTSYPAAPAPTQAAPSALSPTNRQAPRVDYYEKTGEYRPPASEGPTHLPRSDSMSYSSNNPFAGPKRTGNQPYAPPPNGSMIPRRLVPGNAFSAAGRFPVNPSQPSSNSGNSSPNGQGQGST